MTTLKRLLLLIPVVLLLLVPSAASAETEGTGWEAFSQVYPTNVAPGKRGVIQIDLFNTGAKPSSGAVTVTDTLPEGMVATAAGGMNKPNGFGGIAIASEAEEILEIGGVRWVCTGTGTRQVTCTSDPLYMKPLPRGFGSGTAVHLDERVAVEVEVGNGLPEAAYQNRVSVSGGGATGVTVSSDRLTVSSSEPSFGFADWDVWFSNAAGEVSTQAGSHPYETTFALAENVLADGELPGGQMRNDEVELPPGFFGEPNSAPRCARWQLNALVCPADTQIGTDLIALFSVDGSPGDEEYNELPLYNMVPPEGVVDEFALNYKGFVTLFQTGPRGYGDYRLITHIDNIPNLGIKANIVTLWGIASESSHNDQRYGGSLKSEEAEQCDTKGCSSSAPPRPFLTLPTSCGEPQAFTLHGNGTWGEPEASAQATSISHNEQDEQAGFTGCSGLSFDPSIATSPDTSAGDSPAGLGVNVTFPQEALRTPGGLVEATVKNTTVTLPEGLVINPGQAAGLTACTAAQARLKEEGAPACPSSSKVGTAKVKTPLLEGELSSELEGGAYVLEQSKGDPGEPPNLDSHPPTLELLITLSGDGVNLKLVANVQPNPQTGQLTTTLTETPELPFTSFELEFSGGAQAALATPVQCGTYTTTSDFTPWSSPFDADFFPQSSFQITGGPGGGPCLGGGGGGAGSNPLSFHPELTAGATTDQAGGFTNFSLLLQRGDGQQRIDGLQFKAPAGLTGELSKVPLCPEPVANEGKCSESSKIGHAAVASGPGPYPLVIPQPGNPESQIYLTGPFNGTGACNVGEPGCAPFGLSILTHVIAGPFNLGNIVTRAKIELNPYTAALTITTNPLPQIVDGVPTDLRLIDSVIERPEFMINPTNCNSSEFSGTAYGTEPPGPGSIGQADISSPIGSHFGVGSCQALKFTPELSVSTQAKTSKSDGASLTYKVSYPSLPQGSEANITKAKVELPEQLPSRLTTLQKACTASQFAANPAGCPAPSVIGHAVVHTQLLPVPLEGPVYFVSNGGEAFPNLVMVLQGYGVTIDLVGDTLIKNGVTSTTFKAVPDQPFESFEITLPEGPYSALAANGNLCKPTVTKVVKVKQRLLVHGKLRTVTRKLKQQVATTLTIPSEYIGQNGAVYKADAPIAVTGCPPTRPKAKVAKKTNKKKGKKKK